MMTFRGTIVDGDYSAFCRTQRNLFNRRFGLDGPLSAERLTEAVGFATAEYHKLRQVERVVYRRRVSQKLRGRRTASRVERAAEAALWQSALARYRESLEQ